MHILYINQQLSRLSFDKRPIHSKYTSLRCRPQAFRRAFIHIMTTPTWTIVHVSRDTYWSQHLTSEPVRFFTNRQSQCPERWCVEISYIRRLIKRSVLTTSLFSEGVRNPIEKSCCHRLVQFLRTRISGCMFNWNSPRCFRSRLHLGGFMQ